MENSEKGSGRLSTAQIVTAVIVPILVVLLPLIFGDTPFSRLLWGKLASPTAPIVIPTQTALAPTDSPAPSSTPASLPSPVPTETFTPAPTATATAIPCAWSGYLNSAELAPLGSEKCVNELGPYGISSDGDQELAIFLNGWDKAGIYGLCRDVSGQEEIKFHLDLKNNPTARFLIVIAPEPNPVLNSHALRLQFEEDTFYFKGIDYTDLGVDRSVSFITADERWKKLGGIWGLDFVLSLTPARLKITVNGVEAASANLSSDQRYLCFAHQTLLDALYSNLDAKITFPSIK